MKIAFPRNQQPQPNSSRDSDGVSGAGGTNNNNNVEKKRLTTKKLIPQFKANNAEDKSGSDSDSSWCSNVSTVQFS